MDYQKTTDKVFYKHFYEKKSMEKDNTIKIIITANLEDENYSKQDIIDALKTELEVSFEHDGILSDIKIELE